MALFYALRTMETAHFIVNISFVHVIQLINKILFYHRVNSSGTLVNTRNDLLS